MQKNRLSDTAVTLNPKEIKRYARHLVLAEFGLESQQKLKSSRVLVVGAGGLGAPLLLYLAAAGVGHIGIVDFDTVDESNLQRQVLYTVQDVGQAKAEIAQQRLRALNPYIDVQIYQEALTSSNALEIISQYEVVADGTDNFPTRYLVNDACVIANKVNVYASIFRFEGQVAVFNMLQEDGKRGPNYRDLFPAPPPPNLVPNCAEGGVLGVLPGIIGSMQANEVIKVLTGIGEPLSGKLFLFDAASFTSRVLKVHKNPQLQIDHLIDYEEFCGMPKPGAEEPIKEIEPSQFLALKKSNTPFQLIDVREPQEYSIANLGGTLIPLRQIEERADEISKTQMVIIHCQSGKRSTTAIRRLQKLGFDNLYNLKGGIDGVGDY